MWESKEREWEKERQARERLMKEVPLLLLLLLLLFVVVYLSDCVCSGAGRETGAAEGENGVPQTSTGPPETPSPPIASFPGPPLVRVQNIAFVLRTIFCTCMQAESIEQREAVLRDMEALSVRTAREAHRKRDGQTRRADELQAQVRDLHYTTCLLRFTHHFNDCKKKVKKFLFITCIYIRDCACVSLVYRWRSRGGRLRG